MNISKYISFVYRHKQQFIKERLKDFDISISDFTVVLVVNSYNSIRPSVAASKFGLAKSQVSKSAKGLEELGYVTQERDPSNRNRVNINITPKGRKLATELKKINRSWEEMAFTDFDQEEKVSFDKLLKKIAENTTDVDMDTVIKSRRKDLMDK